MSKINVNGVILDEEAQKKLFSYVKNYHHALRRVESEKIAMKNILEDAKESLGLPKDYVKNAAVELFREETGQVNTQAKMDKEAAVEQLKEIVIELDDSGVYADQLADNA